MCTNETHVNKSRKKSLKIRKKVFCYKKLNEKQN